MDNREHCTSQEGSELVEREQDHPHHHQIAQDNGDGILPVSHALVAPTRPRAVRPICRVAFAGHWCPGLCIGWQPIHFVVDFVDLHENCQLWT